MNTAELEKTRRRILADPSLLNLNEIGRCPIGLTLSRIINRPLTIDDKHHVPELAQKHLGLTERDFDALYHLRAWPNDLRNRWHEISGRRERIRHPQGHLASDEEERAQRAQVVAEVLQRFITTNEE